MSYRFKTEIITMLNSIRSVYCYCYYYYYYLPTYYLLTYYYYHHHHYYYYLLSSSFLACNSRLRSAVHRPHPPQRPVLGHIHCFRQCEIVGSQILLYDAQLCQVSSSLLEG